MAKCTQNFKDKYTQKWKEDVRKFNTLNRMQQEWIIHLGMEIDDILNRYVISDIEMIEIAEVIAEYVTYTRFTDFRRILFDDEGVARLPMELIKG